MESKGIRLESSWQYWTTLEKVRQNKSNKGISVQEKEIKISQFADDTATILDGSKKSSMSALQDLQLFSSISGLRLNNKKTEVLWIGSRAGCKEKLCPEKNLKWVIDKVKSLGVWISTDPGVRMNANFNEKLEKVQNVLSCWKYRRLSLLGKITVLKSLIASQLVYILSPLPTNHRALEEINCIFYNFLWDGKGDNIKRDIMISEYENESLKITDIKSFNKGLKVPPRRKFLVLFSLFSCSNPFN